MGSPHTIGVIGLGVISGAYLDTLASHPDVRIAALADRTPERAADVAASIPGARACTTADLLADPEIELVLNLTTPESHAEIAMAALAQGKKVYGEKPLAATMPDAAAIVSAEAGGGLVGCAPDTVLGTGVQTARAAIDDGAIGRPVSASATWVAPGHELWHPNPDFYYRPGGGPLLDMGPYYLTTLVHLLGPVVAVQGATSRTRDHRRLEAGPRAGEMIGVEIDTHVTGILEHAGGALSTIMMSFDAAGTRANPIEVHGEHGSIGVPDPNHFDGDVRLLRRGEQEWELVPPSAGYVEGSRGVGVLDFLAGHRRAGGSLALHVLDTMSSLFVSARDGRRVTVPTTAERPPLVPLTAGWRHTASPTGALSSSTRT
ncbi:Gfo/Idh/MocA family protein [Microbacterium sp. NPDC078428]|uniref:Gfo/Idh/MocA family protein n=1 Tax=Microbacterium sp. NPDC078428 TaxID=3364190 RepID=UPI0037C553AF